LDQRPYKETKINKHYAPKNHSNHIQSFQPKEDASLVAGLNVNKVVQHFTPKHASAAHSIG